MASMRTLRFFSKRLDLDTIRNFARNTYNCLARAHNEFSNVLATCAVGRMEALSHVEQQAASR